MRNKILNVKTLYLLEKINLKACNIYTCIINILLPEYLDFRPLFSCETRSHRGECHGRLSCRSTLLSDTTLRHDNIMFLISTEVNPTIGGSRWGGGFLRLTVVF